MRAIILIAICALTASQALAAEPTPVPRGATIYIDEMENDLDGFIRAEIVKQKIPLEIVLSEEKARLILSGSSAERKRDWHEGWLSGDKDRATANIMVVERESSKLLWAGEAGDRSLFWGSLSRGGQRKVASRLVNNLKKAIEPAPKPAKER